MAKVVDSKSRFDTAKYAVMFFVFALLFINVMFVFFVLHAVRVNSEYKTKFAFDNLKFESALQDAVSNYFFQCGIVPSTNSDDSVSFDLPKLLFVDGCTWLTPRRVYRCMIDGVEYGVRDFCPYGLIQAITDGRIYCKRDKDIFILRLRAQPTNERTPQGGRSDDGPTLVNRPYLNEDSETNEY